MITFHELGNTGWRKSSYSNGEGGNCLEVSTDFDGVLPVRDSKSPDGPALVFPAEGWTTFVAALNSGSLLSR